MRTLILSSGLLAAALMAAQPTFAQSQQPLGGGGDQQRPGVAEPGTSGAAPRTAPSNQPLGGGGDISGPAGPSRYKRRSPQDAAERPATGGGGGGAASPIRPIPGR